MIFFKEFLYNILNLLTLNKGIKCNISDFQLRLPTRYYKYFSDNYEENNIAFLKNYIVKGMCVVDIGAHIGLYSVLLGQLVEKNGKVYSFEPTPSTYSVLSKTIKINSLQKTVSIFKMAISDRSGVTTFFVDQNKASVSNTLVKSIGLKAQKNELEVKLISLDEFQKLEKTSRIDFIKIDAEGAELSVLKGADNVISRFQPLILLGLHPDHIVEFGDSLIEIWNFISIREYEVIYNNKKIQKDFFVTQQEMFDVFLKPKSVRE